ncbi:hypothetical protein MLD38_009743 [Melastoma candidum]|uniref:Uncharacterized protein n=1 Tax=Melastoma candidum TaxID=119954 RepID=A0ACB9S0G0_9MYRT|nr:hypothetical protein MLD38_009743 [Melastoma candidum]
MKVKDVLFMSRGVGESSYSRTSTYPQKIALLTRPVVTSAVRSLLLEQAFPSSGLFNVADLGCATGPCTFVFMSTVIDAVLGLCQESGSGVPEFQFYLNDLFGNDFNSLFQGLSSFCSDNGGLSCFVMGTPGSFHGRLFPQNSLHLVHSSYSVHWLSKFPDLTSKEGLPLNKGKIYMSETSPPAVKEAYLAQFIADFSSFLSLRSHEMMIDGRLVLILHGRRSGDSAGSKESSYSWEFLAKAIESLVSEGEVSEEKLDTLNIPYYTASPEEVSSIVEAEGSFAVESMETLVVEAGGGSEGEDPWDRGRKLANHMRSFTGSIIAHHFGEEIMDQLYGLKLPHLLGNDLATGYQRKGVSIVMVLKKK